MIKDFVFYFKKKFNAITKNIDLYGPHGSDKTSIGNELSKLLNMPRYDIDDDHLESYWKKTVSEKLAKLGDEGFVEAEAEATMTLVKDNTIIYLSVQIPCTKKQ